VLTVRYLVLEVGLYVWNSGIYIAFENFSEKKADSNKYKNFVAEVYCLTNPHTFKSLLFSGLNQTFCALTPTMSENKAEFS
jgi:hypothetical protein